MTSVDDNEAVQIVPDPDKLFVYHRQQLSAMLDGELSPDEAKFMLRRLQHDTELAACWERWQVCGDVLRGERNDLLPADFARRVSMAVGTAGGAAMAEPVQRRTVRPRLVRWGGGAAVAASVALMAVFVGRQLPDAGLEAAGQPTPSIVQAGTPPVQPDDASVPAAPGERMPAAVADAAPVVPQVEPDATAALAAAAVAAVETPRRVAQRRQARTQRAAAAEAVQAPVAIAAANDPAPSAALAGPTLMPSEAFAMPQAAARPWPRTLLTPQGGFAVSSGGLLPREPQFEPLLPGGGAAPWTPPASPPAEPQADTQP